MTSSKKILGLDLSLTATGIHCDDCGGYVYKPKTKGVERLHDISEEILTHTMHSDVAIIEGYSFGSQGRATFNIGELGGVVRLALFSNEVPFVEVAPAALKKFATGKGNVGKDEVLAAAIRKFNFNGTDNNEADAYILNRIGNSHYNGSIRTTYQQEVVDKIEWKELEV